VKAKFQEQMKALFAKHKVNPLRAVMWPLAQFPIFIALFMALRDMGTYYPGFATGGALWFIDLSMPDAWLILPIFNSLSFLAMIELGSDGVQVSQQGTFKWAMRGLGVAMVPLTMSMPQGLFVYWSTNNSLSVIQTVLLKQKALREFFDIPEQPKEADTPVLKMQNPIKALSEALERERSQKANAKAEILEGIKMDGGIPGPPPSPPPVSFAMPPRKKKTRK
jgi:YidC/Oxa1 family membrane protein insertase